MIDLYHGKMEHVLPTLPDKSVDLVCTDPPYEILPDHAWDKVPDLEVMWREILRVLKPDGTVVMTSAQPFTTDLIISNRDMFRYTMVWVKDRPGDIFNAKGRPMRKHEDICVFSHGKTSNNCAQKMRYYPPGLVDCHRPMVTTYAEHGGSFKNKRPGHKPYVQTKTGYPSSVLTFARDPHYEHPTQKPLALMSWIIEAHTLPGDTVLDPYGGVFSSGVAAVQLDRKYIGVEMTELYFLRGRARIQAALEVKGSV